MIPLLHLLDDDKGRRLPPWTTRSLEEAWKANRQGMGAYWCPNYPEAPDRRIINLSQPAFAYVDIDDGDKLDQLALLDNCPVPPARVVETKRGHQAYWRVSDLTLGLWDEVVRHRLVPFFGADRRACDPVRLLRVPGFFHMKNRAEPFQIRVARRRDTRTTVAELRAMAPAVERRPVQAVTPRPARNHGDDILAAVSGLDARTALDRLSGTSLVRGERFSFRPAGRGRWNIIVDGKCTSCFVDEVGRIGGGGGLGAPTAIQWISYYYGGKPTTSDWRAIAEELRRLFPEFTKGGRR